MRKKILIAALVLLLVVTATIISSLEYDVAPPFCVVIESASGTETIVPWQNDAGCFYVFLPSYAELEDAMFQLNTENKVVLNGAEVYDNMVCKDLTYDTGYVIEYATLGTRQTKQVFFMKSGKVAALFVDTETKSMDFIHEKKGNKESGTLALYTQDGYLDHTGNVESIKGRGNYTWDASEKKPYNLFLTESANLLGMGMGNKWVLLANSSDVSQMRNKMVYDFAKEIDLAYAPDSQWVDLYLNGEYRGLYLLSEAVEIGPDRVNISGTDGVILALETEDILRGTNDTYFLTDAGVAVEVRTPLPAQDGSMAELQSRIQFVEDAFLSDDPELWKEEVDVDSWVKKFLIDEVFGNLDAFIRSSYFYYGGNSDKLFAGPVWDYDMSSGNENEWSYLHPNTFYAYRPARMVGYDTPWIYNLCQKDAFWSQAAETYRLTFIPELERLMQITIDEYEALICQAAALDDIRWRNDDLRFEDSVNVLRKYMEKRIDFLTESWCEGREYCVIQALQTSSGSYCYYVVCPGETLSGLPEFEDTEETSFVGWYYADTNEPFDITKPITEDIAIYAKREDKPSKKLGQLAKMVPLGVIAVMGCGLLVAEIRRRRRS